MGDSSLFDRARPHAEPVWDGARHEAVRLALVRRRARRSRRRAGTSALTLGFAAAALALLVWWDQAPKDDVAEGPRPVTTLVGAPIAFSDGSSVTALDAAAAVEVVDDRPSGQRLLLRDGEARFDVTPNPSRHFEVRCGPVRVRVLGTQFDVRRRSDDGVRVAVRRGRVEVAWPGGTQLLEAGEAAIFPPNDAPSVESTVEAAPEELPAPGVDGAPEDDRFQFDLEDLEQGTARPTNRARARRRRAARARRAAAEEAARDWRALARDGDYARAYAALERDGMPSDPPDLMLAADVARRAGHPARALPYLRRVCERFPQDDQAGLAAFTAGRLLLGMGEPRRAASAFAQARRSPSHGYLAEDALAREVEAWSAAGDAAKARARADEYLSRYPSGQRERAVRQHGGLDR